MRRHLCAESLGQRLHNGSQPGTIFVTVAWFPGKLRSPCPFHFGSLPKSLKSLGSKHGLVFLYGIVVPGVACGKHLVQCANRSAFKPIAVIAEACRSMGKPTLRKKHEVFLIYSREFTSRIAVSSSSGRPDFI